MSKLLKIAFIAQAILGILVGLPMLLAPGRFLSWVGWVPVDPILSRLLGAALVAMAWTSIYAARASSRAQVGILVQMQAIFSGLGALGCLRHLMTRASYPSQVWITFIMLVVFTVIWIWGLISLRKS